MPNAATIIEELCRQLDLARVALQGAAAGIPIDCAPELIARSEEMTREARAVVSCASKQSRLYAAACTVEKTEVRGVSTSITTSFSLHWFLASSREEAIGKAILKAQALKPGFRVTDHLIDEISPLYLPLPLPTAGEEADQAA